MLKRILIWFAILFTLVIIFGKQSASYEAEPIYESPTTALRVDYSSVKMYALSKVRAEFGLEDWKYFYDLVNRESGWVIEEEHYPNTKKSTAFGLGGFLNSTWEMTGYEKTNNPYVQINAMIVYVKLRYNTSQQAIAFHDLNNFY